MAREGANVPLLARAPVYVRAGELASVPCAHEFSRVSVRKFLSHLAACAPLRASDRVRRAAGVLPCLSARCVPLHESGLHAQRRDAASFAISFARRGRRRRKPRVALRLVPPPRRSRGSHWGGAACFADPLADWQIRNTARRGADAR